MTLLYTDFNAAIPQTSPNTVNERYFFNVGETLVTSTNIPLQEIGSLNYTNRSFVREIRYELLHNGKKFYDNRSERFVTVYELTGDGSVQASILFTSPQESDAGLYELQFAVHYMSIINELNVTNSCESYINFLNNNIRLDYYLIGTATLDIRLDGK